MDRLACVDVPALPLQLLVQREPDWAGDPIVVVDRDSPQGRVTWVNERARGLRILPGMRYAAALGITRDLRASVVEPSVVEQGRDAITELLRDFSPHVEPCDQEPGTFWLDASGLSRLFRSASHWARSLREALDKARFSAKVSVGFSRFGCYALAKSCRDVCVVRTSNEETDRARAVRLDRLHLDPNLREALTQLGIHTLGEFLELPAEGLGRRFGTQAQRLRRLAAGDLWTPLQPQEVSEPLTTRVEFDFADQELERLLFWCKRLLDPILTSLGSQLRSIRAVTFRLDLDDGKRLQRAVRMARPTLDGPQILDLVRLSMEGCELSSGVVALEMTIDATNSPIGQLDLWSGPARRDRRAGERALARLRAEFGPQAVVRARLKDAHLPEGSFLWEPLDDLPKPRSQSSRVLEGPYSLVRRIYQRPQALPPKPHHLRDDGWLIRGRDHGPVVRFIGPYVVSGGWWNRPVHREYHFAQTQRGDLLWVYYDRRRRRWFLQGQVE